MLLQLNISIGAEVNRGMRVAIDSAKNCGIN
ncbi:MAG: hypothetical protein UZ12_BCD005002814 [Bacteroidetes bacterium OLB12]|nr:MAG: hypothetical protein UZ12_BCD005002814 [Bacteroidetes bacterium OLB12]